LARGVPMQPILWFEEQSATQLGRVGGKNASLSEMIRTLVPLGVRVPAGFAVTADAYWQFLRAHTLEAPIAAQLDAMKSGRQTLQVTGAAIRRLIGAPEGPAELRQAITAAYRELGRREQLDPLPVAVRSSATAEDLPTA